MCHSGQIYGYLAFHSVSIIWYILRKYIPDVSERRLWMRKILQIVRVAGASHESVLRALDMENFKDFEDCLQNQCAETVDAQYIITNNTKDFKESTISAITAASFCQLMNQL
jgi:predicted nucleic acid-binding protein